MKTIFFLTITKIPGYGQRNHPVSRGNISVSCCLQCSSEILNLSVIRPPQNQDIFTVKFPSRRLDISGGVHVLIATRNTFRKQSAGAKRVPTRTRHSTKDGSTENYQPTNQHVLIGQQFAPFSNLLFTCLSELNGTLHHLGIFGKWPKFLYTLLWPFKSGPNLRNYPTSYLGKNVITQK